MVPRAVVSREPTEGSRKIVSGHLNRLLLKTCAREERCVEARVRKRNLKDNILQEGLGADGGCGPAAAGREGREVDSWYHIRRFSSIFSISPRLLFGYNNANVHN